jgi:D-arabinose 1-dehydrogenase-like Zn-dependent alcohol dehydrogenase
MTTIRAVVVREAGGDLQVEETAVPTPAAGDVLVRVHACGVCHGDLLGKAGLFPGVTYPLISGHEIAEPGDGVVGWEIGQRIGLGWYGGGCGHCEFCPRGSLALCPNMPIAGITRNGGYADYVSALPTRWCGCQTSCRPLMRLR